MFLGVTSIHVSDQNGRHPRSAAVFGPLPYTPTQYDRGTKFCTVITLDSLWGVNFIGISLPVSRRDGATRAKEFVTQSIVFYVSSCIIMFIPCDRDGCWRAVCLSVVSCVFLRVLYRDCCQWSTIDSSEKQWCKQDQILKTKSTWT